MNQDLKNAGFSHQGQLHQSVTKELTKELEKARSHSLGERIIGELERDHFERWSWEAWGRTSAVFLHSPPDHFGFMEDPVFQHGFANYLGQPCPLVAPLVGMYFGSAGKQIDEYGANLAAAALPGMGWKALHDSLEATVQQMMKLGGIHAQRQAVNFMLGKVGEPYMTRYIDALAKSAGKKNAKFAVIPDLHAVNYPRGMQRVNDSGATMSAEAIFEVKTYSTSKVIYSTGNQTIAPPNRRADRIVNEYKAKLRRIDENFAPEVVGSGGEGVMGPFETSLSRFYRRQVIPLVAGWFGEIGRDFEKTLVVLAKEAAASDFGRTLSPLANTEKKGGAFPMLLQQFRRAIAVSIVRGNAALKMSRLHYVRGTPQEAKQTHQANMSKNKYRPGKRSYSWYSEHAAPGYDSFQQFKNQRGFQMNWG